MTPGIVLALYGAASLATFAAFAWDKLCAKRGLRRIPESTLHFLELCGGWPGALAGQALLRHKSAKPSYRVVLWAIVALHGAGWAWYSWSASDGR